MDLKQLNYFIHVVELGSFTRASNVLDIAQPALSRQVRLLELELQQTLLLRNGRGVVPTDAGKVLLERGRGILHQVTHLREELGRLRGALIGRVALGLPHSLSPRLAAPLVLACAEAMPEVTLSIVEGLSTAIRDSLISGRLDIALLYNPSPTPEIDAELLIDEQLCLVSPLATFTEAEGGNTISLDQLAKQSLIMPSRPNPFRALIEDRLSQVGLRPRIALEVDGVDPRTVLSLVAKGVGSAVLLATAIPDRTARNDLSIRVIDDANLHIRVYAAVSSQRPTTHTQRKTIELIREILGVRT